MTIHRLFSMLLGAALLFPGIILAQEKGNDLHYVLTRVDDPDPAVRESAFQVCRMASADGVKLIEEDLADAKKKFSPAAREQLGKIIKQQHAVRQKMQADEDARQRWLTKTTIQAYDDIGSKNPAWNDFARDAMTLWYKSDRTPDEENRLRSSMRAGGLAKCDDALFNYVHYLWVVDTLGTSSPNGMDWLLGTARGLEASRYSASRKIIAYGSYFQTLSDRALVNKKAAMEFRADVEHFRDSMIALIPDALQEQGVPRDEIIAAANSCLVASVDVGIDRKISFDLIYSAFPHELPESAELLTFKGEFLIDYAWDARGSGWANTVTANGFNQFDQRIADASDALQAAWASDPESLHALAATQMIIVCMAQSVPDATRELWFKRAFESNPDNYAACRAELVAVDPRWIGDRGIEKMHQFGRMCELSGNESAKITLDAASVQMDLACSTVYSDGTHVNRAYLKRPGVWPTITRVYLSYLEKHPTDRLSRGRFIACAAAADQWDLVNAQVKFLIGFPDAHMYVSHGEDYAKVLKIMNGRYKP